MAYCWALWAGARFSGSPQRKPASTLARLAICIASAVALTRLLTGAPESLIGVMAALAAYGVGLGLYSPPTTARRSARRRPINRASRAASSIFCAYSGPASASRPPRRRSDGDCLRRPTPRRAPHMPPEAALLSAVGTVLAMLAGFGAIGGAAALIRGKPKRVAEKPEPTPLATPDRGGAWGRSRRPAPFPPAEALSGAFGAAEKGSGWVLACRVLRRRRDAREAVNDVLAARRLKAGLHYRKASAALELIERPDATSTPSGSALG